MGVFEFPDLTFKKSGVTSKGLNKNRKGGNHSHPAAWILISYLAQGDTQGERFRDAGRLQSTFKKQQIKKQGARGESRDIEKLQLRGIFGSMWRVLLMGLNETITALLLIAFVLSHESIDYPLQMSPCSALPGHPARQHTALGKSCSWAPATDKFSLSKVYRTERCSCVQKKNWGHNNKIEVDGEAAV